MTRQSAYWYAVVGTRVTSGSASLVDDAICRSILSDAADQTFTTGFCGRTWIFPDKSRLIANRDGVTVR